MAASADAVAEARSRRGFAHDKRVSGAGSSLIRSAASGFSTATTAPPSATSSFPGERPGLPGLRGRCACGLRRVRSASRRSKHFVSSPAWRRPWGFGACAVRSLSRPRRGATAPPMTTGKISKRSHRPRSPAKRDRHRATHSPARAMRRRGATGLPRNRSAARISRYYERFGFSLQDEITALDSPPLWLMWREPARTKRPA